MTVREWARRWPRYTSSSKDTQRRVLTGVKGFVELCGDQSMETLDLSLWALRNPTRVRFVRVLLGDAVRAGVATRNACDGIRAPVAKPREYHVPSESEVRRVAGEMGVLRKFTLVAAFSGLRVSEACDLETHDILENGRLRVRAGKGGKTRTVALFAPEAVREAPQTGHLFLRDVVVERQGWHRTFKRMPWDQKSVNKRWLVAKERAGLPANTRFHDLRRFHATWLLDRGATDLDVAIQLGHFDASGAPNAELIRRVYGRPDHEAALSRLQLLA